MRGHDQFHVGIVLDDLDAGLAEMTEMFGYEWAAPLAVQTPVVLPDREFMLDLRFAYSVTEPRVELVQSVAGNPVGPRRLGSGVHHVGYWSDDVAADAAVLEAHGYANEAKGVRPDGAAAWAYHRSPRGPRIELVSRELQPGLEQYWGLDVIARPAVRLSDPACSSASDSTFGTPSIADTSSADRYEAAIEMAEWADRLGGLSISVSEHHGSPDGYLPSPIPLLGAMAARTTSRFRLMIAALIAPFYEPLRLAEDLIVLDIVSRGRVDLIIGAGYVHEEFDLYGDRR